MINLNKITTEERNKNTINIDKVPTNDILEMLNKEDATVAENVKKEIKNITKVVDIAIDTIKKGGKIFYIGAGTSGRLGILDASEILPTYGEGDLFVGIIAGGTKAIQYPVENAEDNKEQAIQDLINHKFSKKDLLIGIAASGRTPYVISALEYANSISAKTASIATSANSLIGKVAKNKIEVVVGPEPITGSTRMKSGTAQKLILNMISTATMISLGKTYSNYMVDLVATNDKLVQRGINMLSVILEISKEESKNLYLESNKNIRAAIIMYKLKTPLSNALKIINENKYSKVRNLILK